MLPVIVRVENLETKSSVQHVFHRSPVHIGRNKLNELPFTNGFVSLWHGILRFGENTLEYLDLDSTNGTEVDGHRVRRNVFVPVTEQTDLRIGTLRLHLSRSEAFVPEPKSDQTLFGLRTTHLGLQPGAAGSSVSQAAGALALKPATGQSPPQPFPAALPDETVTRSLSPAYESYRQAWQTLHTLLRDKLDLLPNEQRAATLQLLRQQYPLLEQEEQFRALEEPGSRPSSAHPAAGAHGGLQRSRPPPREGGSLGPLDEVDTSTSLLRIFVQTYASESAELRSVVDVKRFLEQLAAVLEAFSQAFLELRRGNDQFGKEIAVPVISDQTPLRHAKAPRDLLRYLLDAKGHEVDRIRSLTEGFADVMIHQVALLNGIRQGISALLNHLSPGELQRSAVLSRKGPGGVLLKGWPFRAMNPWRLYLARHQELLQDERAVQSVVFGSEFAFAYAQIVGGNVKSAPKPARTNGVPGQRATE